MGKGGDKPLLVRKFVANALEDDVDDD